MSRKYVVELTEAQRDILWSAALYYETLIDDDPNRYKPGAMGVLKRAEDALGKATT